MKYRAAAFGLAGLFVAAVAPRSEAAERVPFPTNLRVGVAEVVAGSAVMVVTSPVRGFCTVLLRIGQLDSPQLTLGQIWGGATPTSVPNGLLPLADLHRWTNARIFVPFGAGISDGLYQLGIGNGTGRDTGTNGGSSASAAPGSGSGGATR